MKKFLYRVGATALLPVYVVLHIVVALLSGVEAAVKQALNEKYIEGYRMYWAAFKKGGRV
jgi:hypothetical protein